MINTTLFENPYTIMVLFLIANVIAVVSLFYIKKKNGR